jgi:hypothetical protein
MANYGGIRFMSTTDRRIALNPAVAATLDWSPDTASWVTHSAVSQEILE